MMVGNFHQKEILYILEIRKSLVAATLWMLDVRSPMKSGLPTIPKAQQDWTAKCLGSCGILHA